MDINLKWIVLVLYMVCSSNGAKILGIFPTPSSSNQIPFRTIMRALAARGHQVTIITTDPLKKQIPNYTEIDISFSYKQFRSTFDYGSMHLLTAYNLIYQTIPSFGKMTDEQLSSPQIQAFIKSSNSTTYDVIFLEALIYQAYHGLIHKLGSPPVIGILSLGSVWAASDAVGTPTHPAYIPDCLLDYGSRMTFFERLESTIFWLYLRYKTYYELFPIQDKIMRKHFGDGSPSINEAENNMSLLMIGTNPVFSYPVPVNPTVIHYHSIHVKSKPDPLPRDLKKYLDEAKDGVIYLSLGVNVFSDKLPIEKRQAFIDAFSELPQKVIWKWESDILPGKPENVKIEKWLPQQDLLAHPNVKLFITQCGLQSLQEAVHFSVPVLGIPFFADQRFNAKKIKESGIGLILSFQDLTNNSLLKSISEILYNQKYKRSMKMMSILSMDEPESPLERVIWWTEYVVRHKGTAHMRTSALDLKWYQYLLLDIIAFILLIVLTAIFIVYYFLKLCYKYILKITATDTKSKTD